MGKKGIFEKSFKMSAQRVYISVGGVKSYPRPLIQLWQHW